MKSGANSHKGLSVHVLKIMGIFSGVQVLSILCAVVRTKLVAIWLGPEGMGLFGLYNSGVETMNTVAQMSTGTGVIRSLAAAPRQAVARLVKIIRRWGCTLGLIGASATLLLSPWLSEFTFGDRDHSWGFALLSIAVFFSAIANNESSISQGLKQYSRLAKSTVWGVALGLAVSAPMYYFWGLDSIIPSLLAYPACICACYWIPRPRTEPAGPVSIRDTFAEGKEFAILGIYITLTAFASNAASYIFMSYLNHRADTETAGFFQAGFTLVNRYVGLVLTAIGMEYLPRLSQVSDSRKRVRAFLSHEILLIMLVLFPVVALFVAADELIIRVMYAEDFLVMLPFVTWAVVGTIFRGWSWCMAFVILARNDGKAFLLTEVTSAIAYILLNIIFFENFGIAGMGYAYILWYLLYTLTVWGICRRRYRLSLSAGALWMPVGIFLACAATALIRSWVGWWGAVPFAIAAICFSVIALRRIMGISFANVWEKFVRKAKKE